ncbi:hypothetical protein NBO_10g0005 [Nosema bombycis CQ1]|uniref:Uncharacterized protein n=1 Tax=Nosema bombycis (strain CQ1 / CVCC 102059) TaxID=578461 RepID=R0MAM8_NOSB1|nr:hypothetical protein NBO_10g0005 [Nosema bombycis CQ1]|eukprot:EOB15014.1 hypothetical protein NBO_10g0005 [Nosema bombycis CQ1]
MIFSFLVFVYTTFCHPVRSNDFSTREQPIITEFNENKSNQLLSPSENKQPIYINDINCLSKDPVSVKSRVWGDVAFCAFSIFCLMCANYVLNLVLNAFLYLPGFLKWFFDHIIFNFSIFPVIFCILVIWLFYYEIFDKVKSFFNKIMVKRRKQDDKNVLT